VLRDQSDYIPEAEERAERGAIVEWQVEEENRGERIWIDVA
jgi:hypothetical protein